MLQDLSAAWYVGKNRRFASKLHSCSHLKCNVEAWFFTLSWDRSPVVHPAISAQSEYGLVNSSLIKSLPTGLEVSLLAKGLFLSWMKMYLVYRIELRHCVHVSEACQRTAVSYFLQRSLPTQIILWVCIFSSVVKRRQIWQENSDRGW